jgi:hypothetical protein
VRFRSALAGADGSRFTYRLPVARSSDSAVAPALFRTRVWRNSGGFDVQPLGGVQLHVDAASQRDLRDYGDSTTVGRLLRRERRSLLGQDVGAETQRTVATFLSVTPLVTPWLRPRATVSSTFAFNLDPNARDPVRDIGDSAGGFHLPVAFVNSRRMDLGLQLDPRGAGRALFGDSAALGKLLGRLSSLDLSYGRALTSTYDRVGFAPSLGYQLALGGFDAFRSQRGVLAGSAGDNWTLNAAGNAALLPGMRMTLNYRRTAGVNWILRTDQQVPLRGTTREWPSATLTWTVTPRRSFVARVLTSASTQFTYREQRSTNEQFTFGLESLAAAVRAETFERTVHPAVSLTWRGGVLTSFDAATSTSDQVNAGNSFRAERNQYNGSFVFTFRPPAWLVRLKSDIRTTARYTVGYNQACLRTAGRDACVPFVDSRQTQSQLTLDTDFPPTLSAGFQMAYLVNDERQANRKTSQLVITAFVELHTSVGQIR